MFNSEAMPVDSLPMTKDCKCPVAREQAGMKYYLRRCFNCDYRFESIHCPHDHVQSACPNCNVRAYQWEEGKKAKT